MEDALAIEVPDRGEMNGAPRFRRGALADLGEIPAGNRSRRLAAEVRVAELGLRVRFDAVARGEDDRIARSPSAGAASSSPSSMSASPDPLHPFQAERLADFREPVPGPGSVPPSEPVRK
jgi:hypothetical protein